jgi:glycosyltransferase 2 family protein
MNKKVLKIIGNIFTLLCLAFIVYKLTTFNIDFSILFNTKVLLAMLICIVLLCLPAFLNAFAYERILRFLGATDVKQKEITEIYVSSNIGKYLPGNVMHFAGRNVLGAKYGLSNKHLLLASFFEVGLKVMLGVGVSIVFSYQYLLMMIKQSDNYYFSVIIVAVFVIMIIAFVILSFKLKGKIRLKETVRNVSFVLTMDFAIFLINIICFIIISFVLMDNFTLVSNNILSVSGIYILAWLIGYVTPGAPGGIGVKEAVMVFLLSSMMLEKDILLIAIVLRLCNVLGDLLSFIINKMVSKKPANTTPN